MKNGVLIILFSIFSYLLQAQTFTLTKSLEIDQVTEVSKDRKGNIYYATFDGDIIRLSDSLSNEEIFSPPNPNATQILDAWQGLRIFTFNRDLQQYRLINRNLSLHEDYTFPIDQIGFVELATSSYDNNVWLIDQTDFSLKKFRIHNNEIQSNTPLNLLLNPDDYEILHCREYQNRVFISSKNVGILIFDNFGNYIRTFNYQGIAHFGFWDDKIYFLKDQQLYQINLYNDQIGIIQLPSEKRWEFVLMNEHSLFLFSDHSISLYTQNIHK